MSISRKSTYNKSKEEVFGFSVISSYAWYYGIFELLPLWIPFVHHTALIEDAYYRHARPTQIAFEIVLKGCLKITINKITYNIYPGEMIILPAAISNEIKCEGEYCEKRSLGLVGSCADLTLNAMRLKIGEPIKLSNPERFIECLDSFCKIYKRQDKNDLAEVYAGINRILMELKLQCSETVQKFILTRAMELFNSLSYSGIKVDEIADELNISYDSLYLLFKTELGISPKAYITQKRMTKAKILLKTTRLSMKEIAFACGYQSPFVFSKVFSKHFSISPTKFRLQT